MPSVEIFRDFFDDWDHLEACHPFGVMYLAPTLVQHGVVAVCAHDVDEHLFLDLMVPRNPAIRRIKVEGRVRREVFWVYVDLDSSVVSFQASPSAPFVFSLPIPPTPDDFVRMVLGYFRRCREKRPDPCLTGNAQSAPKFRRSG